MSFWSISQHELPQADGVAVCLLRLKAEQWVNPKDSGNPLRVSQEQVFAIRSVIFSPQVVCPSLLFTCVPLMKVFTMVVECCLHLMTRKLS